MALTRRLSTAAAATASVAAVKAAAAMASVAVVKATAAAEVGAGALERKA